MEVYRQAQINSSLPCYTRLCCFIFHRRSQWLGYAQAFKDLTCVRQTAVTTSIKSRENRCNFDSPRTSLLHFRCHFTSQGLILNPLPHCIKYPQVTIILHKAYRSETPRARKSKVYMYVTAVSRTQLRPLMPYFVFMCLL